MAPGARGGRYRGGGRITMAGLGSHPWSVWDIQGEAAFMASGGFLRRSGQAVKGKKR